MARCSIFGGGLLAIVAGLAVIVPTAPSHPQTRLTQSTATCDLQPAGTAHVRAVRDRRTLLLGDGRELRLAGIETPPPDTAAGTAAKEALEAMVDGHDIALKTFGQSQDRYGRTVAYIFIAGAGGERQVQHELLASGHAMVAARIGSIACARILLAAEREARTMKRGLWAASIFTPRDADQVDAILRNAGVFTLVSGKVLSVRESGATIYINFGRRWSRDFTVTMLKRNRRLFSAAGIEPEQLKDRHILVRGIVERRGGPLIEAARPEQIEIVN